jgi:hypothetical protein
MTTIDVGLLELVYGGLPGAPAKAPAAAPAGDGPDPNMPKASYLGQCGRGAVGGAITGAGTGASMLPFAMMSGPLTPGTAAAFLGVGLVGGGVVGCADGMWELYKARHPVQP